MNNKSREKLLAGVAALSLLASLLSKLLQPESQRVKLYNKLKKSLVTFLTQWDLSLALQ